MRVPFPWLIPLALVLAACQSDAPVQPSTRASLSLRVNMQQAPAGSTVEVQVFGFGRSSEQELPPITLFDGTFPVTTGLQQAVYGLEQVRDAGSQSLTHARGVFAGDWSPQC